MTDGARTDAALRASHLTMGRGNEPSGSKSFFPEEDAIEAFYELYLKSITME